MTAHAQVVDSVAGVRTLLRDLGMRPEKAKSQHFLIDRSIAKAAVHAAKIRPDERIIEVGGGLGLLTEELAATRASVTTVELDRQLAFYLDGRFRGTANVEVIEGDFFRWFGHKRSRLPDQGYAIVANLPYQSSSYFFRAILSEGPLPRVIVVMLQKEVAERAAAPPGKMSLLSVAIQLYAYPEIMTDVPKKLFWPVPNVDSALLRLSRIHQPQAEAKDVLRVARIAFAGRRKQLINTLASGLHMDRADIERMLHVAGIDPSTRPQELSIREWTQLAKALPR